MCQIDIIMKCGQTELIPFDTLTCTYTFLWHSVLSWETTFRAASFTVGINRHVDSSLCKRKWCPWTQKQLSSYWRLSWWSSAVLLLTPLTRGDIKYEADLLVSAGLCRTTSLTGHTLSQLRKTQTCQMYINLHEWISLSWHSVISITTGNYYKECSCQFWCFPVYFTFRGCYFTLEEMFFFRCHKKVSNSDPSQSRGGACWNVLWWKSSVR